MEKFSKYLVSQLQRQKGTGKQENLGDNIGHNCLACPKELKHCNKTSVDLKMQDEKTQRLRDLNSKKLAETCTFARDIFSVDHVF